MVDGLKLFSNSWYLHCFVMLKGAARELPLLATGQTGDQAALRM